MEKGRWIYFIQLNKKLPEWFFYMSQILSEEGIKLLPVTPEQFSLLFRQQYNVHALIFTPSVKDLCTFEDEIKPLFKQLISNKMLTLYHLSSFYSMKAEFNTHISHNQYVHVKLPVVTKMISYWISDHFDRSTEKSKVWPGGRRATLPAMGA